MMESPPADEVLHRRAEVRGDGAEGGGRDGVSSHPEDVVPDREHEAEVAVLHAREVHEGDVGVADRHGVRDRGREDPRQLVRRLRVETPGIPSVDERRHVDEGPEVAPWHHAGEARGEGLHDATPIRGRQDVRRVVLEEDGAEPEVATRVLPEGHGLKGGVSGEALAPEGLEVVGGADAESRGVLEAVRGHDGGVEFARALDVRSAEGREERSRDAQEGRRRDGVETRMELRGEVAEVERDVRGDVVDEDRRRVLEGTLRPARAGGVRGSREDPDVAEVGRVRVHDPADDDPVAPKVYFFRGGILTSIF